jgi:hypothetical protein
MQMNPQIPALLHVVYINIVKQESRHIDTILSREGDGTTLLSNDLDARAASPSSDIT